MQSSIEVLAEGETWLVRIVDADGEHELRFFSEESARSYEAGQRVRLHLPPDEHALEEHAIRLNKAEGER